MKFLIGIVFLLCALNMSAQEYPDSGFTNKAEAKNLTVNGLKEGKWVEYVDSNGDIMSDTIGTEYYLVVYKAGKRYGIAKGYDKKYPGKLQAVIPYKDGEKNGVEKGWDENGILFMEVPYTDGKEDGVEKWYSKSGKLQCQIPYSNGKVNGVWVSYFDTTNSFMNWGESSLTRIEMPFINGKEDGIEKWYYSNGILFQEIPYINGEINGIAKEYSENGKLESETTYKNNKIKNVKNFDKNGNEIK